MRIVKINSYRDGSTIRIVSDEGDYCIDNRMNSETIGKVFIGPHPEDGVLDNFQKDIISHILIGLENYKSHDYESWSKWNLKIRELLNV